MLLLRHRMRRRLAHLLLPSGPVLAQIVHLLRAQRASRIGILDRLPLLLKTRTRRRRYRPVVELPLRLGRLCPRRRRSCRRKLLRPANSIRRPHSALDRHPRALLSVRLWLRALRRIARRGIARRRIVSIVLLAGLLRSIGGISARRNTARRIIPIRRLLVLRLTLRLRGRCRIAAVSRLLVRLRSLESSALNRRGLTAPSRRSGR